MKTCKRPPNFSNNCLINLSLLCSLANPMGGIQAHTLAHSPQLQTHAQQRTFVNLRLQKKHKQMSRRGGGIHKDIGSSTSTPNRLA